MNIRDYPALKDELIEQMVAKAITSTGDFNIWAATFLNQYCLSDCFLQGMDDYDKHCAMSAVIISQVLVEKGEGIDEAVESFKLDLNNHLIAEIQEHFISQMQPILDNYWEEQNYDG